jgi:hypothetical protein
MNLDPNTINAGLTALGTGIVSKDLIVKILGPTADYIGSVLKGWTERRVTNTRSILIKAAQRLGSRLDEEGTVPPRVLKEVLDEGSYCDDELTSSYFAGVLASSRSEHSRDDRGASLLKLVGRMTTYQVHSHYIYYSLFKQYLNGRSENITVDNECRKLSLYVPHAAFIHAMSFADTEDVESICTHIYTGLLKEKLIADRLVSGNRELLTSIYPRWEEEEEDGGVLIRPSALGVELYQWVHGEGRQHPSQFLEQDVIYTPDTEIAIPVGAKALPSMTK